MEKQQITNTGKDNQFSLILDIDGVACDIFYAIDCLSTMCQTLVNLLEENYDKDIEYYYLKQDRATALQYTHIIFDYIRNIKDNTNELVNITDKAHQRQQNEQRAE